MSKIDPHAFGNRLKKSLKVSNITQKDLAQHIGVSKTSINNYVNGRIPDVTILYLLSSYLGISMEWLLTGKEYKTSDLEWIQELTEEDKEDLEVFLEFLKLRREKQEYKSPSTNYITPTNEPPIAATKEDPTIYLPILGDAAAGIPIEIIEVYQGRVPVDGKHNKSNSFIIRARGDSMIGEGIHNGDLVIFKAQPTVENGEIALVNVNGEATIKKFYLHNGKCELHSANPLYPPMEYCTGDITILGKFVEVLDYK